MIPLGNAPDSGPLERVQSGFSRDLRRLDQLAAALPCVPVRAEPAGWLPGTCPG